MNRIFPSLAILILTSCAATKNEEAAQVKISKAPHKELHIMLPTLLNLVKNSYIKGCVDMASQYEKGEVYKPCEHKAQKHVDEVQNIILAPK